MGNDLIYKKYNMVANNAARKVFYDFYPHSTIRLVELLFPHKEIICRNESIYPYNFSRYIEPNKDGMSLADSIRKAMNSVDADGKTTFVSLIKIIECDSIISAIFIRVDTSTNEINRYILPQVDDAHSTIEHVETVKLEESDIDILKEVHKTQSDDYLHDFFAGRSDSLIYYPINGDEFSNAVRQEIYVRVTILGDLTKRY